MKSMKIAFAAALFAVGATAAIAQTATTPAPAPAAKAPVTAPAPAAKAPAATTAPTASATDTKKGAKAPQTPEAKACSDQADAQKLHGKLRKDFRKKCMKTAKDATKAATAKKPS